MKKITMKQAFEAAEGKISGIYNNVPNSWAFSVYDDERKVWWYACGASCNYNEVRVNRKIRLVDLALEAFGIVHFGLEYEIIKANDLGAFTKEQLFAKVKNKIETLQD